MRSEGRYISKTKEVKSQGIALITDGWLSKTCKSIINVFSPNHYLANPYYDLTLHEVAFHCVPPSIVQKVGSYLLENVSAQEVHNVTYENCGFKYGMML